MYHPYKKESSYLREALYKAYKGKCFYCSISLEFRQMHVDHILPTNRAEADDEEIKQYFQELEKDGFFQDSIENYVPTCSACNIKKGNLVFKAQNIRYYHEIARKHSEKILSYINHIKGKKTEDFYEPIDLSIWEELSFQDQRDLSHAVMGYRLTDMDVEACPVFPQVDMTERQLNIVNYAVIQGETGCGKSISLYQVAHRFFKNGWRVYLLRNCFNEDMLILPNNSEKSLYIIDDAQSISDSLIDDIIRQSRCNKKVLLAKTISQKTNSDSIILLKADAVKILYKEYLKRKDEILPIVKCYDNTIGVNFSDIPIENRLEDARKASTPWQFSYILRGGWRTMKELYRSICDRNNCDLLAAAIAAFQILQLDKIVDLNLLYEKFQRIAPKYKWDNSDLELLTDRRIVLSKDEIRIVHLESAYIIISLFFDAPQNEKQGFLLEIIEDAFLKNEISPLGIVWLCNGCNRYTNHVFRIEDLFLTDRIIDDVSVKLYESHTSEEIRNIMYLLKKILVSQKKDRGKQIIFDNLLQIINLIGMADSISAWGFSELLNSLYNYDHNEHNRLASGISWTNLLNRMKQELNPNYYAWGRLFNRGLSLLRKEQFSIYKDDMYEALKSVISSATVFNIEGITDFIVSVSFFDQIQSSAFVLSAISVYKKFFEDNTERAIHLVNFDFMCYIFCMDLFEDKKSKMESVNNAAKMFVDIIPYKKVAKVISNSSVHEWLAIRDILYFIYSFDKAKYACIIKEIDLIQLSDKVKNSWDHSHEISLIIGSLATANTSIARNFLAINNERVISYYPVMIIVDPKSAIKANKEKAVKIDLLAGDQWSYKLDAIKALYRADNLFCIEYLKNNIVSISQMYSNVCALDFSDKESLEFLKEIKAINEEIFTEIVAGINKAKVLEKWDQCCGINPHKVQWVRRRKREFFEMIGITYEN